VSHFHIAILIISVLCVYLPGLPGGFIFDDYWNILDNPSITVAEFSLENLVNAFSASTAGPLGRPISMVTFYINYQLGATDPLGYKLVNIGIHIINVLLVYIISLKTISIMVSNKSLPSITFESNTLAFWIALIWAIHPINLTAVLYIIQRMTSLSAMFTLIGILLYFTVREHKFLSVKQHVVSVVAFIFCALLAIYSKENGVLLFIYLLVIECFVFKWKTISKRESILLPSFFIFSVLIPFLVSVYIIFFGGILDHYDGKPFGVYERLLTETRAIWFYIIQILIPQADKMSLYHDDFIISKGLFLPYSTFISIFALSILLVFIYVLRKKKAWISFCIAFFLSGHLLESTIIPLNLVYEYRNYLPSIGLIFLLVMSISFLVDRVGESYIKVILISFSLLLGSITASRAYDWHDPVLQSERMAQRKPRSFNAQYELGSTYIKLFHLTGNKDFVNFSYDAYKKAEEIGGKNIRATLALIIILANSDEDIDETILDKIIFNLQDRKIESGEIQALTKLVECMNENICKLPTKKIKKIFYSILNNHFVGVKLKNSVAITFSSYLFNVPGEEEELERLISEVVSNNPDNEDYRLALALTLIKNNKQAEAYKELQKIIK
jgi:protein O-mannosyl-transferase